MNIRTRISLILLCLSAGVVIAAGTFSTLTLQQYFLDRIHAELQTQARQMEYVLDGMIDGGTDHDGFLRGYCRAASIRLTLIDSGGTVLFESDLPRDSLLRLDNHRSRPEVQEALHSGTGSSSRRSSTFGIPMLYLAATLHRTLPSECGFGGTMILRVAMPLRSIDAVMTGIRSKIFFTSALVLLLVGALTIILSRRIAQPIREMALVARQIRNGALDRRIPVRSEDEFGQLAGALNSMVDRLNEDILQLQKLEQIRSQFLGNVSHELRTPLFALQGMLETLLGGAIDDAEVNRDFVTRALANTRRLDTLLRDLIEISRIESGEMKMSFRYFPVDAFLASIVDELTPIAGQKGLSLSFHPGSGNSDVYGDRLWLKQAIVNIIENAIKYTFDGSITVSTVAGPDGITIAITDTGIGIPAEHLPRIFERFYRVDKERSREAGGTGLGLAIAKHIIEAHQSAIRVSSEPERGSAFSFTLSH